MNKLALVLASSLISISANAEVVSMAVPGAETASGQRVLTFIVKDPPGQRCNGNLQVAAEVANTYRVPIQLLPSSMVPSLPAPAVFYGTEVIVADGDDSNGTASFQIVSDFLEMENAPKQARTGLLLQEGLRHDFDKLKATIRSGGK